MVFLWYNDCSSPGCKIHFKNFLLNDVGLQHVCCNPKQLFAERQTPMNMVALLLKQISTQQLRDAIIRSICLLEDERSSSALCDSNTIDGSFDHCICEDQKTRMLMRQFLDKELIYVLQQWYKIQHDQYVSLIQLQCGIFVLVNDDANKKPLSYWRNWSGCISYWEGTMSSADQLILNLLDHDRRENALAELTRKIGVFQDLARFLWLSFGTMVVLLQEVLSVYPFLSQPSLTHQNSLTGCAMLSHFVTVLLLIQRPDFCLSKKIGVFQDLARLLWFSFGTMAVLLQGVLSVYPLLSPPSLTVEQSNRVCNALALLEVATFILKKKIARPEFTHV